MYSVCLGPGVEMVIRNYPILVRKQIEEALQEISECPHSGDKILRLARGGLLPEYRYKVGEQRIIYSILENEIQVWIIKVGPRKTVYGDR